MEKMFKTKLVSYLVISAISFAYFVMPQKAGISVPFFVVLQFICLFFIVPNRKPLFMFIPIFILALNSFISGNNIWYISNFLVVIVLYSIMILMVTDSFPVMEPSIKFLFTMAGQIITPFFFFDLPVKWGLEANPAQIKTLKRVLLGIVISIPCLVILIMVLASADQIFSTGVANTFAYLQSILNFSLLIKLIFSIVVGFYLFGLVYSIYAPETEISVNLNVRSGDLIIINIVLASILFVYTLFALIQFRYLFASGAELPYGLTYTYYARRGFFELLFLSGVNIFIILLIVKLTQKHTGTWVNFTKVFCCYLCVLTFVLLISSFYRMWLYNMDGGLTRLRFLVLGFLIFEAVGLVFTFLYILKPKFNIIAVYLSIGLIYYLLLNIIPMDAMIAKDQINRYFATGKGDIEYTLSLSPDAAPQISRLLKSDDAFIVLDAQNYFLKQTRKYNDLPPGWQKFNLSVEKCKQLFEHAKANVSGVANTKVVANISVNTRIVVNETLPADTKPTNNTLPQDKAFHDSTKSSLPREVELNAESAIVPKVSSYANDPLNPESGLTEALRDGLIRKVTREDIRLYLTDVANGIIQPHYIITGGFSSNTANSERLNPGDETWDIVYEVLSPDFTIPPGLGDKYPITFILPENMPTPSGSAGQCKFIRFIETRSI